MALARRLVENHIAFWEAALDRPYYPYRAKWPSRLFHHAPLENAVRIIADGNLRSRIDPHNHRVRDVAAPGVIDHREHAHGYARLYFRPKTPTQWHIEGIRRPEECQYGDDTHAPILVMMVFDARSILSREGVCFCDRNMQLGSATIGDTEDYFNGVPFEKVFHEGGINGDRSIIDHRCAEVLVPSPLELEGNLQTVFCRTSAERDTLIHALGELGSRWRSRIVISDDTQMFNRRYAFVEDVGIRTDGVSFQLNPRFDRQPIRIALRVLDARGRQVVNYANQSLQPVPAPPSRKWRVRADLLSGNYLVEIELEGHLAFRSKLSVRDPLV
jgi:hypothetical protein